MSEQELLAQLYDINEFIPTSWWQKPWPYLVALALLCASALIFLIIRWRQKVSKRPLPLWERTLRQLETLAAQRNPTLFYQQLTDILKAYVQERYGVALRHKTDQELVAGIHALALPADVVNTLVDIMSSVTEVKFAQAVADSSSMERDLARAQQMIRLTIPQEQ